MAKKFSLINLSLHEQTTGDISQNGSFGRELGTETGHIAGFEETQWVWMFCLSLLKRHAKGEKDMRGEVRLSEDSQEETNIDMLESRKK